MHLATLRSHATISLRLAPCWRDLPSNRGSGSSLAEDGAADRTLEWHGGRALRRLNPPQTVLCRPCHGARSQVPHGPASVRTANRLLLDLVCPRRARQGLAQRTAFPRRLRSISAADGPGRHGWDMLRAAAIAVHAGFEVTARSQPRAADAIIPHES